MTHYYMYIYKLYIIVSVYIYIIYIIYIYIIYIYPALLNPQKLDTHTQTHTHTHTPTLNFSHMAKPDHCFKTFLYSFTSLKFPFVHILLWDEIFSSE